MISHFTYLLGALVLLLLIGPVIESLNTQFPFNALIFLLAIILTLRSVTVSKKTFYTSVILAILAFIVTVMAQMDLMNKGFGVIGNMIYATFILMAIFALTKRMIIEKKISADTIRGGVCVYFLIAFLWSQFYFILYTLDHSAFDMGNISNFSYHHLQYFSFTVLTTLGFGDITPVSSVAMNLTSLESIAGQMFLAIFIARLIGMYIAQELNK